MSALGTLYIIATPIGNLKDISLRALETLQKLNIIVCEDTRITRKILNNFNISNKKLISYGNHNLKKVTPKLIDLLLNGESIALVSDAGTPLISDPGYLLVTECYKQNLKVTSIPGASSIINALILSGLSTEKFYFGGFLPYKNKELINELKQVKLFNCTVIYLESPHNLLKSLKAIEAIFGSDFNIVIARELTKLYEEIIQDKISNIIVRLEEKPLKGEIVILFTPKLEVINLETQKENLIEIIKNELSNNKSVKTLSSELSIKFNISKNEIYNLALSIKNEQKQ